MLRFFVDIKKNLVTYAEKGEDVFPRDLGLVDGALLTETVGKPLRGLPIQRPGQGFDVFCIIGSHTAVDGHGIVQRAIRCALLLVH